MSEDKDNNNYIILKYNSIEKRIEIPEEIDFDKLQKLFFENFNEQKNETFVLLYIYLDEDGDQVTLNNLSDSDFTVSIEFIKKNNVIINVEKEEINDKKDEIQEKEGNKENKDKQENLKIFSNDGIWNDFE